MHIDSVPFVTSSESVGAAVVVRVAGELDCTTTDELSGCLDGAVEAIAPPAPVVVDLTELRFLGAQGIGMLLDHQDMCLRRGSALVVVANTAAVLRPLEVLELTEVLGVRPCVSAVLTPEGSGLA